MKLFLGNWTCSNLNSNLNLVFQNFIIEKKAVLFKTWYLDKNMNRTKKGYRNDLEMNYQSILIING